MAFDPADPAFVADPYPVFAALRATGDVHWNDHLGLHVAVSHAACSAVLRDRGLGRIWRDKEPVSAFSAFNTLHRNSLLENEPPTHTRLRRLISAAFGRGHVERMRPAVEELATGMVESLVAAISADGWADLLEHVAEPLPIEVIGELLGVPVADRAKLRPWSNTIVKMYEYGQAPELAAAAEDASAEFADYLRHLTGRPGLVSDLVAVRDGTDKLSDDELVATGVLLLMAGHEATVNVVGNGVLALLEHRDQWDLLVTNPALLPSAVEELLRFDPPLQLFERTATVDVTIAGQDIAAGTKIAALLGAAAHDPAVVPDPAVLDITRTVNPHLSFGAGIHYCVGAPLARIEIEAALRALTQRLPGLRPAGTPVRRPEFVIRGLRALPVC
ncbi:cytochrome P450 [Actinokineospora inagensis]|uniref:cytochrome P450 n=1 Tax=Actinokineospora inagensis TaxID=103730 RepID=UPI000419FFE5|nr:cytochrome P450 [Actinokineospora inagensis]